MRPLGWRPPEPLNEARYPIVGSHGFHEYKSDDLVQVKGKGIRIFQIRNFRKGKDPRRPRRLTTFAYLMPVCLKDGAISKPPGKGLRIEIRDLVKVSPLMLLAKEAGDEADIEDQE